MYLFWGLQDGGLGSGLRDILEKFEKKSRSDSLNESLSTGGKRHQYSIRVGRHGRLLFCVSRLRWMRLGRAAGLLMNYAEPSYFNVCAFLRIHIMLIHSLDTYCS